MVTKKQKGETIEDFAEREGLQVEHPANGVKTVVVPIVSGSIQFPTDLQPHLCCRRRKKSEAPQADHGVTFRRVGNDCHVYAYDGVVAMRVVLEGEADNVPPAGCVVPSKAFRVIAEADGELAAIAFKGGQVRITVDGDEHKFRVLDVLPFGGDESELFAGEANASRKVSGCSMNAKALARLQRALACEYVELLQPKRGRVIVQPGSAEGVKRVGVMALWTSVEDVDA